MSERPIRCIWPLNSDRRSGARGTASWGLSVALPAASAREGPVIPSLRPLDYDPIVARAADAARSPTPAYVDD
eukprot:4480234-Alexandrium_andersonii.AAC.1